MGEAALTGGGRLPARFVIYAAAMGDEPASARSIRSATRAALGLASEHRLARIAFPMLGTGVADFPFDRAAGIMLEEIHTHLRTHAHPTSACGSATPPRRPMRLRVSSRPRIPLQIHPAQEHAERPLAIVVPPRGRERHLGERADPYRPALGQLGRELLECVAV